MMEQYQLHYNEICNLLTEHQLLVSAAASDCVVKSLSYSSRSIGESALFFCKGFGFKKEYLEQAVEQGISAYVAQEEMGIDSVPGILVTDVRKAMSVIAAAYYRYPAKSIKLIGLTGTKGKTTTTFYIKNILDQYLPYRSAVLSTVEMYTGDETVEAHLTTPESVDLQKAFADVRRNRIEYLTMEVSSQGYNLNRVYGVKFDIGMFLNIDEDHIGPMEHKDFDDYFRCKLELMKNCRIAIICRKTKRFDEVYATAKQYAERVVVIGEDAEDDFWVEDIKKLSRGFSFTVCGKDGYRRNFAISQEGRFNIENALCAIAVAKQYDIPNGVIAAGIADVIVQGRMNVFEKNGVKVIVDYAHNHLSFSELFASLRQDYPNARITVVCGCPGGKAYIRRRDIGTLCGKYADMIYLTEEDPQFEDVVSICEDMASFIQPFGTSYVIQPDRTRAIEDAIAQAQSGDVVILAGKGEEIYQKVKGEYVWYESDLAIAKRCTQQ